MAGCSQPCDPTRAGYNARVNEPVQTVRASSWRLLLLIAPLLWAGIDAADCEYHMEVMSLASSQETWLRARQDPDAWLIPSWNGAPRVNKPPLTVWLHLLAWRDLDPARDSVDTLVTRARILAATLGLLSIFAVWGIGTLLHDARFGWLAAAITGTSLLFLRNMRIATYDAYLLAFSTFAIAAALFAMRPRGPPAGFAPTVAGWLFSGVFMAAAYLTKGPISLLMTLIPMALIAVCLPDRPRNALGLAGAALLAAALTAPWYLYVLREVPAAARIMGGEYQATRTEFQPPWYYLGLIGLVAPWSLWLFAFWVEAARKRIDWRHPAIRVAGIWFLTIFIILSIPAAKQQRYIIPILPAAGLLMAALLSGIGSRNRGAWIAPLARIHGWMLIVVSVLLGVFALAHPWLLSAGLLKRPEIAHFPNWLIALLAVFLTMTAHAILKAARRMELDQLARRTAGWMFMAAAPLLVDYAYTHHARYQHRAEVEEVMRIVGTNVLRYAETPGLPNTSEVPDGKMLLYSRRIIPLWTPADGEPEGFLMAARHEGLHQTLEHAGWSTVREFHDGNLPRRLYRAGADAASAR